MAVRVLFCFHDHSIGHSQEEKNVMALKKKEKYSDRTFQKKVNRYAKKAGRELIELALQLYYTAQSPTTPVWVKGIVFGALAYFINPIDAIPDVIPIAGFSDDLAAALTAIASCSVHITPEIKKEAAKKAGDFFD